MNDSNGKVNTGSLYAEHVKDLKASGLSDQTIEKMEVYSLKSRELLGLPDVMVFRVDTALVFPYFDHGQKNNFVRAKLFPPYKGKDGTQKYWQAPKTKPHLYILPAVDSVLNDPAIPLFIVEGEKKTAKAVELGLPAVGLGGVWNWKEKNIGAIEEFNTINWSSRTVTLVPDSDTWTRDDKNLRYAMYLLTKELEERGANVKFKTLGNSNG